MVSLSACMQCAVCSSSCSMRYNMNVRKLIARYLGNKEKFWSDELWNCTTCHVCQDRCPRGIPITDLIVEARSRTIESGRVPADVREMLESVQKFANPFGVGKAKKRSWHGNRFKFADEGDFEYLYFAGCGVVDDRVAEVARKAAELLEAAGINFAILREEGCCGNDVKAVGEEGLFELLREENMAEFEKYGVEKIIVSSPHCYNAFKNDYGLEVYHVSEIFDRAIKDARLRFRNVLELRVTFHDSCYLGRYNGLYDSPREVLKAIPGIELVEMPRNRENALCCGAGGGNIVRDVEFRPSLKRIDEASLTAADIMAVSCPFCLMMLEDAAKVKKAEIQVMDVTELLYESVFG
ncbi:(Fe-S)-binding protein [Archaeoglobus sp.]